jgi:homoserine kinase
MIVRVRVPATSANLGPGFDALGLALALYNEVTMTESDGVFVSIRGEGQGHLDEGADNLVVRAASTVYEAVGRSFGGISIECVNRIPLSRGLGSSAAAWLGGLLGANALLGAPLDSRAILSLAAKAEGHPDNVAAALHGGITVACEAAAGTIAVSVPVPDDIQWVVLVPDMTSATSEARAVLPATVPRADAVFNVQRVALLLASLQAKRADLLNVALHDRLHQPYRARLFPWMPAVAEAARQAGALGCVLSGAGPSLLAAVGEDPDAVGRAMVSVLESAGVRAEARRVEIDPAGARTEVYA